MRRWIRYLSTNNIQTLVLKVAVPSISISLIYGAVSLWPSGVYPSIMLSEEILAILLIFNLPFIIAIAARKFSEYSELQPVSQFETSVYNYGSYLIEKGKISEGENWLRDHEPQQSLNYGNRYVSFKREQENEKFLEAKPQKESTISNNETPSEEEVNYCQDCGNPNPSSAVQCVSCGSSRLLPTLPSFIQRPTSFSALGLLQLVFVMSYSALGIYLTLSGYLSGHVRMLPLSTRYGTLNLDYFDDTGLSFLKSTIIFPICP